ncbi:hypothetical protein FGG08_000720, partial [Glutinoglossum americanum]
TITESHEANGPTLGGRVCSLNTNSILTFIDFSWNVVQGTYEVYSSASGTTAENAHISTVLKDLQETTEGLHSDLKTDNKYAKQLSKLAKNCLGLSRELTTILEKLRVKERNSRWQAVKATWASMRKEKVVASIEKRLGEYRAGIVLCLNLMLFSQQSSVKAQLDKIHRECLHLSTESANHMAEVHKDLAEDWSTARRGELLNRIGGGHQRRRQSGLGRDPHLVVQVGHNGEYYCC